MNTSDGQEAEDILDLIGIGIGPFNLGLAALLHPIDAVKARFFDTRDTFVWHEGLLLDNCYLQVPFMADLVTMVDPTSPFSFLNYLKEHGRLYQFYFYERFHIARTEYSRYCRWVAEQLCSLRFSMEVVDIEARDSLFRVTVRNTATRALSRHLAKNIVLGVGTVPSTPDALSALLNGTDFIHSSQYAFAKPHLHAKRSITVIGGGQSAAECFLDLLEGQKQFGYELNWLTRGSGFLPDGVLEAGTGAFLAGLHRAFFRTARGEAQGNTLEAGPLVQGHLVQHHRGHLRPHVRAIGGRRGNRHCPAGPERASRSIRHPQRLEAFIPAPRSPGKFRPPYRGRGAGVGLPVCVPPAWTASGPCSPSTGKAARPFGATTRWRPGGPVPAGSSSRTLKCTPTVSPLRISDSEPIAMPPSSTACWGSRATPHPARPPSRPSASKIAGRTKHPAGSPPWQAQHHEQTSLFHPPGTAGHRRSP